MTAPPPTPREPRATCLRCHKPASLCVCASVPDVPNRTGLVILQHRRERFHPVGTTRLARLGLARAEVHVVAGTFDPPPLPDDIAVLYPAEHAVDLATLAPSARPRHLLVLDGTWHQARRLLLDNPWIAELPAVRFEPDEPSRYRIRRQAAAHHVSTIESIVAALRLLEPDTPGLDELLGSFDHMVADQERFMEPSVREPRFQRRRVRASRALPDAWRAHPERLVVVYGETAAMQPVAPGSGQQLVSWTALRPATGEHFESLVRPLTPPLPSSLEHMGLQPDAVAAAPPLAEVATAWRAWRRDDDLLAAWDAGRLEMLARLDADPGAPMLLKALWCNVTQRKAGALDALVRRLGLSVAPAPVTGRASLRLGEAVAAAEHLWRTAPELARADRDDHTLD